MKNTKGEREHESEATVGNITGIHIRVRTVGGSAVGILTHKYNCYDDGAA
jgi:hypothetical protein